MVTIPKLVQDFNLRATTNAVCVDTCKFTKDSFNAFFTGDPPAPSKIQEQLASFETAYQALNQAYAVTLRSSITDEIRGLDEEGDQLILGVNGMVDAAVRMTFDQQRTAAAGLFVEFRKKYKIDVRENMISEWSKVQHAYSSDSRSPIPMISVHSVGDLLYRRQS